MNYDIIIIGGGPAGLSFACSMAQLNIKILIVEKSNINIIAKPQQDGREIALTHSSVEILKKIGVWSLINKKQITSIMKAEVFDGDSPALLNFKNSDTTKALGYLVSNHIIRKILFKKANEAKNVTIIDTTEVEDIDCYYDHCQVFLTNGKNLKSKLIIAADSRFSTIRKKMGIATSIKDFSKVMIVTKMKHELPHNNTALEYFNYGKTLALLPMNGNNSSVVITLKANEAKAMLKLTIAEFNTKVTQFFKAKLGDMKQKHKRYSYPLIAVHADTFIGKRFALMGDAAVSMHPVTAHGFNLNLKGQDILAKLIKDALSYKQDIGSQVLLKLFEKRHKKLTMIMFFGTNKIVDLFTNDAPYNKPIRKLILKFSEHFPPIKYLITQHLTATKKHKFLPF